MATTTRKTTTRVKAEPAKTESTTSENTPSAKIVPKDIDMHQYITVRNGAFGKLIYISPRTGERFVWEDFGDEQEMELQELRNAKAANKKFYERNWFMFDEDYDWVIDFLGVRAFYNHALSIDNFDDLFTKKPAEIEKIISGLSSGQKKSVSYRARQLVADGVIDSMKVINTLEKCLDIELIEK